MPGSAQGMASRTASTIVFQLSLPPTGIGFKTHVPRLMTHVPGLLIHVPGLLTHVLGLLTNVLGLLTHVPGLLTHVLGCCLPCPGVYIDSVHLWVGLEIK